MPAQIGSIVPLWLDTQRDLVVTDCMISPTGRVYQIVELRRQTKGKHAGRWHIKALIRDHVPQDCNSYNFWWYPRKRKTHA